MVWHEADSRVKRWRLVHVNRTNEMAVLLVSYDLNRPGQNYPDLIKTIERYTHCKALKSMYFIDTAEDVTVVRDKLMKLIDGGDQLYVMRLRKHWAATRKDQCTNWLQNSSRTWD